MLFAVKNPYHSKNMNKPRLRNLEITKVEYQGEEFFYFHDRLGIAKGGGVPESWGGLLSFFDGQQTQEEIIAVYAQTYGEELPAEILERVIAQLDEALLLESPRFHANWERIVLEFESLTARPASLAGLSYPERAEELQATVDSFSHQAADIETGKLPVGAKVRGIVVPHIDFNRGGVTEALAYRQLLEDEFDTFIVLGIAHSGVHYPFCGIAKDFETPLGAVECDHEFMEALQQRLGEKFLAEQFAHKSEHSVEFVAVFLKAFEQLKNAKIVPIICGGFFTELLSGESPIGTLEIAQFIHSLREVVEEQKAQGKRVGFIASVDLAHVGSRFGDDEPLTPARLEEIRTQDLAFLQTIEQGDAEAMHTALAKNNNARNVDAHPAVYTFLAAFPELRAQLLDYRQAYDEEANSVVSFAAMTLFEETA